MKVFLMALGLMGALASSQSAQAQQFYSCSAYLQDQYGRVLEQFDISDRDYNNACNVALSQCQQAQTQRHEYTYCNFDSGYDYPEYPEYPGDRYPGPDRYTHVCTSLLKDRYSRQSLRSYQGTGYSEQEACQSAQYQCLQVAQRRAGLYCEAQASRYDDRRPRPIPGRRPLPPRRPRIDIGIIPR